MKKIITLAALAGAAILPGAAQASPKHWKHCGSGRYATNVQARKASCSTARTLSFHVETSDPTPFGGRVRCDPPWHFSSYGSVYNIWMQCSRGPHVVRWHEHEGD